MTKSHFRAHTTNLFQKVNVLKSLICVHCRIISFCFKFEHSMLPHYFITKMKNYFQQTNNLKLPIVRHEFAKHCISNKYPITCLGILKKKSTHIVSFDTYIKVMTMCFQDHKYSNDAYMVFLSLKAETTKFFPFFFITNSIMSATQNESKACQIPVKCISF